MASTAVRQLTREAIKAGGPVPMRRENAADFVAGLSAEETQALARIAGRIAKKRRLQSLSAFQQMISGLGGIYHK